MLPTENWFDGHEHRHSRASLEAIVGYATSFRIKEPLSGRLVVFFESAEAIVMRCQHPNPLSIARARACSRLVIKIFATLSIRRGAFFLNHRSFVHCTKTVSQTRFLQTSPSTFAKKQQQKSKMSAPAKADAAASQPVVTMEKVCILGCLTALEA